MKAKYFGWVIFVQGVSSHTVISNLALREGRKDISDILGHFFSRKHIPILISKLAFIKKKWEIMKNTKNASFHNFPFLFHGNQLRYQNVHMFSWKKAPQNIRNIFPSFSQSQITYHSMRWDTLYVSNVSLSQ